MKTKQIDFSHPWSPNACALGFRRSGCWTVSIVRGVGGENEQEPEAVKGFDTFADAEDYAQGMIMVPWHPGHHRERLATEQLREHAKGVL